MTCVHVRSVFVWLVTEEASKRALEESQMPDPQFIARSACGPHAGLSGSSVPLWLLLLLFHTLAQVHLHLQGLTGRRSGRRELGPVPIQADRFQLPETQLGEEEGVALWKVTRHRGGENWRVAAETVSQTVRSLRRDRKILLLERIGNPSYGGAIPSQEASLSYQPASVNDPGRSIL
jgi:hypothetical protein